MQANRCLYWELKQINCTTCVFNQTGTEKNDTPLTKLYMCNSFTVHIYLDNFNNTSKVTYLVLT